MNTYRILDLDNVLADDAWRIPLIDWALPPGNARYERYHAACGDDALTNVELTRSPVGEVNLILTGRPISVGGETLWWLDKHRVPYKHLLMRNNSDERRSALVKEQHLRWLADHYDIEPAQITSAFDDHPEIVAMYQRHGIPATQVCAHAMSAYFNPLTKEHAL